MGEPDRIPDTPSPQALASGLPHQQDGDGVGRPGEPGGVQGRRARDLDRFGLSEEEKTAVLTSDWQRDDSPRRQPLFRPEDHRPSTRSGSPRSAHIRPDMDHRVVPARQVGKKVRHGKTDRGRGTSHVPSIGVALDKGLRGHTGVEAVLRRLRPRPKWVKEREAGRRGRGLQRSRQFVLPRQGPDLRGRLRRGSPSPSTRAGGRGRSPRSPGRRFLLAPRRSPGREPLRPRYHPGDQGRPRPPGAAGTLLGPAGGRWSVQVVPIFVNVIQYPIPLPARLLRAGQQLGGPSRATRATRNSWCSAPAACRTSSRAPARASTIRRPTGISDDIAQIPTAGRGMSRERLEMFRRRGSGADDVARHAGSAEYGSGGPGLRHYFVPASMTGAGMIILENA